MSKQQDRPSARQAADAAHGLASLALDETRQLRAQAESASVWSVAAVMLAAVALGGVVWLVLRNGRPIVFRIPDVVAGLFPEGRET